MKKLLIISILLFSIYNIHAQTYLTRTGFIGFYSKTPLEDIKAENRQVYAVIDATNKKLAFTLLMKGFTFRKQLMQTHFNENYVESDLYPKASFSGIYTGNIDVKANGAYNILVNGIMNLHGVTKNIEVPATVVVSDNKLSASAAFEMIPQDYNIQIPSLVKEKIAKTIGVKVSVDCIKR